MASRPRQREIQWPQRRHGLRQASSPSHTKPTRTAKSAAKPRRKADERGADAHLARPAFDERAGSGRLAAETRFGSWQFGQLAGGPIWNAFAASISLLAI